MRKTLFTLVAVAALCTWSAAWASPQWGVSRSAGQQSANQQENVQITNGPTVENVTSNSAILAWSTNTGSSAIVHYGTDPNNLRQMAQAPWTSGTHRVTLNNLQPGTTYYFQVESSQGQGTGTGALSAVTQFRTQGEGGATAGSPGASQGAQSAQITNGPVVEFVNDNSAVIAWSTNVLASSVVKYGTDPNNLTQTAEAPWGQETHRVNLNGLQPNTAYYFQVKSAQAQGTRTSALSNVASFQTVAPGAQAKHYPK